MSTDPIETCSAVRDYELAFRALVSRLTGIHAEMESRAAYLHAQAKGDTCRFLAGRADQTEVDAAALWEALTTPLPLKSEGDA